MISRGDWTVLPNGQKQPKNLFDAIARVLKRTGDIESKKIMESYFSRSCKDSTVSLRRGPTITATTSGDLTIHEKMFLAKLGGTNNGTSIKTEEKVSLWMERNKQEPIEYNLEMEDTYDDNYEEDDKLEEKDSFQLSNQSGSFVKEALEETLIGKGYNISGDGEIVDCWTFNESAVVNQIQRYACSRTEWRNLDCYNKLGIFTSNETLNSASDRGHGAAADHNLTGSRVLKVLSVKVSPSEELKSSWTDQFYLSDSFIGDLEKLPLKYNEKNKKKFEKFFKNRGHAFISNGYYGGEMRLVVNDGLNMNSYGEVVGYEQLSQEDQRQFRASFQQQALSESNIIKDITVNVSFRGGAPEHHKYSGSDGPRKWQESVPDHLAGLILNPESDLIYYHDFVRSLPWMDEGDRKRKALALEEAFEDLCIPGRKDVVRGEFFRNVATAISSKLNPLNWF